MINKDEIFITHFTPEGYRNYDTIMVNTEDNLKEIDLYCQNANEVSCYLNDGTEIDFRQAIIF